MNQVIAATGTIIIFRGVCDPYTLTCATS